MRKATFERKHPLGDTAKETQKVYLFPNGWGASVVFFNGSYGYEDGLYELAVLKLKKGCEPDKYENWKLDYEHPVLKGDVRGWLTENDVEKLLKEIESTGEKLLC